MILKGEVDVKELVELFLIFMKIGSIAFGGGYAMLPILQREFVEKRNWVSDEELMDYYAIGQCTPGIIAVNVSTFIGNKRKGILGGIVSTLGFVSIPIVLLIVIAAFLSNFADYAIVKNAFAGIRVCVCVLIFNSVERLWKKSIVNKLALGLFAVIFVLTVLTTVSPALLVVISAIAGIVLSRFSGGKAS